MAIQWGAYKDSGTGQGFRLGIDLSYSGSPSSGAVTVRAEYYIQSRFPVNDEMTLNRVGSITGAYNFQNTGGVLHIGGWSKSEATAYGSTRSAYYGAYLSGAYNGLSPTVDAYITIPARPYAVPSAPSGVAVARTSDTQHKVSWAHNSTSSAPYSNVYVERHDIASNAWKQVASLSALATSWTDTTTTSNNRYRYRVRARNSSGYSGYGYSDTFSTTPAAPSNVVATKAVSNINLTWTNNARMGTSILVEGSASGGAWTQLATLTPWSGTESWTHVNPDTTKTWKYRLRQYESDGNLYSPYSAESNTVQLLAAPAAPTGLSPSSAILDVEAAPPLLAWKHNPVDTTAQTAYELNWRVQGTSTWNTTGKVSSTTQSRTSATLSPALVNGNTYEWRVRTYGQHASASPYSSTATFVASARPTAAVNYPAEAEVVTGSTITATWGYYDPEGTEQNAFRIALYNASGTPLYTYEGGGTDTEHAIPVRLQDGRTYSVGVQVRDSSGLWSAEEYRTTFTVDYAEPPVPTLDITWNVDQGNAVVEITNPPYAEGEEPVVYNELWRSVDPQTADALVTYEALVAGGTATQDELDTAREAFETSFLATAELVAGNVTPSVDGPTAVTDHIPRINGANVYRATAVSALPSTAFSEPVILHTDRARGYVWINTGPGFGERYRLRGNVKLDASVARERVTNQFAGRGLPVESVGEGHEETISVSGLIGPDTNTVEEFEQLARTSWPTAFRDPTGRRWYVSPGATSTDHEAITKTIALSFRRVDHP